MVEVNGLDNDMDKVTTKKNLGGLLATSMS